MTLDGVAFTHNGNGANAANGGTIIIGRSSFVAHSGSALDVTGGQIATFGDNTVAGNAVNVSGSTQPVPRQ